MASGVGSGAGSGPGVGRGGGLEGLVSCLVREDLITSRVLLGTKTML